MPAETFGARLALIRQHFGWNVKEAATHCGMAVESWRGWERDGMQPRRYLEVCRTIADATGADYDWLLDGRRIRQPLNRYNPDYHSPSPREDFTQRNQDDTLPTKLTKAA